MAINLLPFRTRRRRKQTWQLIGSWGISLAIALMIMIIATHLLQWRISNQRLIISQLQQNSIGLSKSYQQAQQWQQAQKAQADTEICRKRHRQTAVDHLKLLQMLPKIIPAGIQLASLSKQDQTLTLTGSTLNKHLLMKFSHDLVTHSQFKHLQALTTTQQNSKLEFTLILSANEATS